MLNGFDSAAADMSAQRRQRLDAALNALAKTIGSQEATELSQMTDGVSPLFPISQAA